MKLISIVMAFMLVFSFPATIQKNENNENYDLLIITHPKFLEELQQFIVFKESQGIKTKTVTLDEIYEGKYFKCNGRDDAEKIKYFIKNAYDIWHIKYVLLVGSAKLIPVRYVYLNDFSSTWEYERRFISDLYYADLYDSQGNFSSWDTNNNGYYGEYRHEINGKKYYDKVDLTPEVAIGRIACRNKMELKNWLNKVMNYRANNRMLLAGGDSYPNDPCGDIPEGIYLENEIADKMAGWETIKLYPPNNAAEISRAINNGVGIAVLEGAGAQHLWATHAPDSEKWIYYYGWNIRMLRNKVYPIILTSGARLAKFDENRECFNWIFVGSRHGGVASIGSTGLCWTAHGRNVTKFYLGNLHVRLFEEYKNATYLGEMWKNAITAYIKAFHWNGIVEKAFHMKAAEELELFGDPSMPLYHVNDARDGKTLYVGGSGPNNYTSIQDAINDAMPGDKIVVLPGVYRERVNIDKWLTILAINATLVGCFNIYSKVDIEGFKITGFNYSIYCKGNDTIFRKNNFNASYGVILENTTCSKFYDNGFRCKYGVIIKNSTFAKFYGNRFQNNWHGIWAENCDYMDIENNNFSSNRWYTLWLERSNGSVVQNNSFYKNWYSIFLYHTDNCIIYGNEILHNEHGPQIVFSSNNRIEKNNICHNEHYGIYVDNASIGNKILRNNIIENAYNARDDGKNIWDGNYWSDYIGNRFMILRLIGIPKYIPRFSFDWHPSVEPNPG